jgi:hypothetical protein
MLSYLVHGGGSTHVRSSIQLIVATFTVSFGDPELVRFRYLHKCYRRISAAKIVVSNSPTNNDTTIEVN